MKEFLINCLAVGSYALVSIVLWQRLLHGKALTGTTRKVILSLALVAIALHALALYLGLRVDDGLNLAFTNAISSVTWAVAVLFLIAALYRPIANLGVVIMPLAGLAVLIAWVWPGRHIVLPETSTLQSLHIIVSVLAYGLLSLAAVQSLLLFAQERQLRSRQMAGFMRALPPLQTMEHLLFQLIGMGFLLLTLTLISGAFFSEQMFGKPLRFTHHMVLSIFAWVVFAILLLGHWRFGWRGRPAVQWTLGGFTLLVLAYFGTKFVLEIILGR